MSGNPTWRIYALGGGLGHFTRSLALARAARDQGRCSELLVNSPWVPAIVAGQVERLAHWPADIRLHVLEANAPVDAVRAETRQWLADQPEAPLVMDTFPRGVGGEAADLLIERPGPTALVHRPIPAEYVAAAGLRAFAGRFDVIFPPGETGPLADLPQAIWTPPWRLMDREAVCTRDEALRHLRVDRPCILLSAGGNREELGFWRQLFQQVSAEMPHAVPVRLATLDPQGPGGELHIWPLAKVLRGVRLLIAGGGYNTVVEARAAGVPFLGVSLPRKYDNQTGRLQPGERPLPEESLLAAVRRRLAEPLPVPCEPLPANGADQAVEHLLARGW